MGQLFDELKRRNVFRVAIAYLVAAWLVLQVADLVLENIGAPDWVMQVLILLFALGFPLVLVFSWAYELTPEGLKREADVDRSRSVTRQTGRKLNQITIGLLLFVLVVIGVERFLLPGQAVIPQVTDAPEISDKSIAVLAFEDLSEGGDQEYFADGLSEELLNVLAQVPDLQVAGRTSSFAFKGQNKDLREIGEILNVAHILEGSVRKAGNRIRVTAQLINADNGFHLFSESYDRDLDDIFAVQDELAGRIGTALQSELIGTTAVSDATPTEIEVYDLYLEARQNIHTRDREAMEAAADLLDRALALDPDYVPALTQKALAMYLLSDANGAYGDIPVAEALEVSRSLLDRALDIDDRYAEAYAVSGLIMEEEGEDPATQIAALRRAIALNPSLENARTWLATALFAIRNHGEARDLLEGIVERDPMFGPAFVNLIQRYIRTREFDKATALIDRVERITGETRNILQARGFVSMNRGELASAVRYYRPAYEMNPSATIVQFFYAVTLLNLGDFESASEVGNPFIQAFVAMATRDMETAGQMVDQLISGIGIDDTIELASFYYVIAEDYAGLAELVEKHYGSVSALLEQHPRTTDVDLGYMPGLAWTYLQLDRQDDYAEVVAAMERAQAIFEADGAMFAPAINSAADYLAVTGDAEGLLDKVRTLVNIDAANVEPFAMPYYRQYFDIDEFQRMNDIIVQRANDERAKLGLGTYVSQLGGEL